MYSYVIILARCGEKEKPLWTIGGKPLVQWLIDATQGWRGCVSTDGKLNGHAILKGKTLIERPASLCTPEASCEAAVEHVLTTNEDAQKADILHVALATSPFLQPRSVSAADFLLQRLGIESAQTVTKVTHNSHEWNQREVTCNSVRFVHERKRRSAARKQQKPGRWIFGNLFSFRRAAFERDYTFWPGQCAPQEIPWWQAIDVDDEDSLNMARAWHQFMEKS